MKKTICTWLVLLILMLMPGICLAVSGEDFARIAEEDIGRNGASYSFTDEWCAMVVKHWADEAGLGDAVPNSASAVRMAEWFHLNGGRFALTRRNENGVIACWTTGTWKEHLPEPDYDFSPQVGDIVFFETNRKPEDGIDHVGICVNVLNDYTIEVVEGNTENSDNSKSVVRKNEDNWKANESRVWGFARPVVFGETQDPQLPMPETSVTIVEEQVAPGDLYGEVREIPQNNMDAVLMLDTSGSMSAVSARTGKEILSYSKEAATAFVDQAFAWNDNYHIGLGTFDSSAREIQQLTGKQDTQLLYNAINRMGAGGMTNVAQGFDEASRILEEEGRADARQIIVLFTDGIHNCSGDPVASGENAVTDRDGKKRDIYTVGMVGALSETEKEQVRSILDRPYAVRYIEIDDQEEIEGAFYLLGLAASGDTDERIHMLRIRGAGSIELTNVRTGESLSSERSAEASFGSVHMTSDLYEAIYVLDEGEYSLRIAGEEVRTIGIMMETMDGRAVTVSQAADLRVNGNAGTRLEAILSFGNDSFELEDHSFDPYTYKGTDPFTGAYYEPEYELKVSTGIANLPNGGLVSQRTNGYSASVPNEANMPDRVHEQELEIFDPFFESEGFIVSSRTSYGMNYDGYTYFFGGVDMKLYRVPEDGGDKEKIIDRALIAYWVDETGIYYGDEGKIVRRAHGESSGNAIVRQGVASGSNLSRMIRYEEYLYFVSAKDRYIYAVPYAGGDVVRITDEPVRCFTIAQKGNDVIMLYNTYDKSRESEYLRVIDLNGNRIAELDDLRFINTHYFNYAHGYLYYCKKSEGCALYRINLNNLTQNEKLANICSSRIFLFDDYVVTTDDSKYYCVMRPNGSEFKTIYAPYRWE